MPRNDLPLPKKAAFVYTYDDLQKVIILAWIALVVGSTALVLCVLLMFGYIEPKHKSSDNYVTWTEFNRYCCEGNW